MAVTGLVLEPAAAWSGPGERPLVGFAVGTHGQGDQCAPSKLLADGPHVNPPLDLMTEYETPFLEMLLTQGMAVVVTDYEGLGTPATHTWINTPSGGHAVIDSVRAARQVSGTVIPPDGPVGFWGYSQGGASAGAAAERVDGYASELDVRGSFVGAPPAEAYASLSQVDGSALTGVIGYYLNGMKYAYPETRRAIDAMLNQDGRHALDAVRTQCLPVETLVTYQFTPSSSWTTSGQSVPDELRAHAATRHALAEQTLGNRTPNAPVLVVTGDNDDIVPAEAVRALALAWCARGATVKLRDEPWPTVLDGSGIGHIANSPTAVVGEAALWFRNPLHRRARAHQLLALPEINANIITSGGWGTKLSQLGCYPDCNPACQPNCSPRCSPTCNPTRCRPNACWPKNCGP